MSINIKSKKKLFSKLQGEHISRYGGSGIEFLELREYSLYDSARHINFKRSNPYQTPLVNIYSDNRELNVVVVYLLSASLEYKDKKELAKEVASTISFIGRKERLNLLIFSNNPKKYIQGIKESEAFDIVYDTLSNINHMQESIEYKELSKFLTKVIKRESIIFLVGDFLDSNINIDEISYLHELYLLIIRDKSEEYLDIKSSNLLNPFNNKINFYKITSKVKKRYQKEFKLQDKKFLDYLIKRGIFFKKIYSKDEIIPKIALFWESL